MGPWIGGGNYGSVYEVKKGDLGDNTKFVAKFEYLGIDGEDFQGPRTLENEFHQMAKVKGLKNFPQVIKFGSHSGTTRLGNRVRTFSWNAIIMTRMGLTLQQQLRASDYRLYPRTMAMLIRDLFHGLMHLQDDSRRIVHLDIKPDNCMLAGNEHLTIGDFGFAVTYRPGITGQQRGSPDFMSRRALAGQSPTYGDDLESVGWLILWLILGGDMPWMDSAFDDLPHAEICGVLLVVKTRLVERRYFRHFGIALEKLFEVVDNLKEGERPDLPALLKHFLVDFKAKDLSGHIEWR